MSKKEDFKEFMRNKPELVDYIRNKEMTLQGFYELYDVYGAEDKVWEKYERSTPSSPINPTNITNIMKNINIDEIQKHINTAQKALGVVEDLTTKNTASAASNAIKGPLSPRPLNKFFED